MHCAIYLKSSDDKKLLIQQLRNGSASAALGLQLVGQGALYSAVILEQFLVEEYRHGRAGLTAGQSQALASLFEGEQKRLLLDYVLASKPDYLILDNLFDSLDLAGQQMIEQRLQQLQHQISLVQLLSRRRDKLAFIQRQFQLEHAQLVPDEGRQHRTTRAKRRYSPCCGSACTAGLFVDQYAGFAGQLWRQGCIKRH